MTRPAGALSIDEVLATPYDPTDYQRVLFVVTSFESMCDALESWLANASERP